ncbi:LapA family protein [Stappia sp. F7233]|uniref:LapA family protein n=1 Tax=Stappia albiluteola TaxID=2758565 RepID=A0A839AD00_9HYPH|nr:LapA family protein [Stappia albiluteola]MBA5776995.1 LapA family protein [Stappia albiluteola]
MIRFLKSLILLPLAVLLIVAAVANRHDATLSLDPFSDGQPALAVTAPLFWFLFAAVAVGVLIGGTAAWAKQGKWRREARVKRREASHWHEEADRLKAVSDATSAPALGAPQHRDAA